MRSRRRQRQERCERRVGTDSAHKKTHALLCQEYLLQGETVIYRIRPRDEKHPVLLPVGQKTQCRMQKDKLLSQVEDVDTRSESTAWFR